MICQLVAAILMVASCPDDPDHDEPCPDEYLNDVQNGMDDDFKFGKNEQHIIETVNQFYGTPVGSAPYPGVRSTYGGTELMVQLSQVNQDLDLLIGHGKAKQFVETHSFPINNPHIFLSGKVEGTGFIGINATGHPVSDIGLTGAEVDVLTAYKALTGFLVIKYLDFPSPVINNRLANTNLFLDVAFVTIGDLNEFPMYLTIGQTFVPFGQYNSYNGYNDPLTKILFRTLATDATIGYYNDTFLGQFFFFKGDSHADSGNNINNYGFNVGAHYNIGKAQNFLQVSYLRNIGDALGFQLAFGNSRNTNVLKHVVDGIDINGSTQIGDHWFFVYEYITALRRFSPVDAAYSTNSGQSFKGAFPQAFDVEASYQFDIGKRPAGISLGWSHSYQAVGFNVPKWRTNLTFTVYIFKGTLLSLEYMHNRLYDKNEVASGQVALGPGGSTPYFRRRANKGHGDDTLTLDISFYW